MASLSVLGRSFFPSTSTQTRISSGETNWNVKPSTEMSFSAKIPRTEQKQGIMQSRISSPLID